MRGGHMRRLFAALPLVALALTLALTGLCGPADDGGAGTDGGDGRRRGAGTPPVQHLVSTRSPLEHAYVKASLSGTGNYSPYSGIYYHSVIVHQPWYLRYHRDPQTGAAIEVKLEDTQSHLYVRYDLTCTGQDEIVQLDTAGDMVPTISAVGDWALGFLQGARGSYRPMARAHAGAGPRGTAETRRGEARAVPAGDA